MRRTRVLIVLTLVLAGLATWWMYHRSLSEAYTRLADNATVAETALGPVAFANGGDDGLPMLVIHGAGGGHDQGRLLAQAFAPKGYRWIAPSRFGYPGTPMPDDGSTMAQADAFAALLDTLNLETVTILAMSGGVPPALQFAHRYPERTRALILISLAPYAPLTAEEQALPVPLWLYDALFSSDFPIWALVRLSPQRIAPMFDVRDDLRAQIKAPEAAFVDAMIQAFVPVIPRRQGLANEGAAIDPVATLNPASLRAPMLVIHARDDRITPFSTAAFTVREVREAEFFALDTGGHLLLGHHEKVRQRIAAFLHALSESAPTDVDTASAVP